MNGAEAGQSLQADLERRFGGLRRLYGDAGYARVRQARVAVIGLGGVGSWAAEALTRSGVARLVLVDLDHVSESNINRQVQAAGRTLGQSKVQALQERLADIHPGCRVFTVEEFVDEANWPGLLKQPVDVLILREIRRDVDARQRDRVVRGRRLVPQSGGELVRHSGSSHFWRHSNGVSGAMLATTLSCPARTAHFAGAF